MLLLLEEVKEEEEEEEEEEDKEEGGEEEGTRASTPNVWKGQKKPVRSKVSRRMGVVAGEGEEEEEEGAGVSMAWRSVCGLWNGGDDDGMWKKGRRR